MPIGKNPLYSVEAIIESENGVFPTFIRYDASKRVFMDDLSDLLVRVSQAEANIPPEKQKKFKFEMSEICTNLIMLGYIEFSDLGFLDKEEGYYVPYRLQ